MNWEIQIFLSFFFVILAVWLQNVVAVATVNMSEFGIPEEIYLRGCVCPCFPKSLTERDTPSRMWLGSQLLCDQFLMLAGLPSHHDD